jgi:signal transduction histidine kinase/ActR/RegA family two-component response regulator
MKYDWTFLRRPPTWLSLPVTCMLIVQMALLRLNYYNEMEYPVAFFLPILVVLWHKDKAQLWLTALAMVVLAWMKQYWFAEKPGDLKYPNPALLVALQWLSILVSACVVHAALYFRSQMLDANDILARVNTDLNLVNEELTSREEEITRQNEELQSQTHELQEQTQQVQVKSRELLTLNHELSAREATLQTLLKLVGSTSDEAKILEEMCAFAPRLLPEAEAAVIMEESGVVLQVRTHCGVKKPDLRPMTLDRAKALASLVMERGQPAHIADLHQRPDLLAPFEEGHAFRSVLAAPLHRNQKVIGVLEVYRTDAGEWSDRQAALLNWLAGQCSRAWELIRLRNQLRERETQMTLLNESLDQQVRMRTKELEAQTMELRRLASQLSTAEHRERRRLAQVLHDDLQQLLVAARMRLSLPGSPAGSWRAETEELLRRAIELSRSLVTDLSPPVLFQASFQVSMEWLAKRFKQQHGLTVTLNCEPEVEPPSDDWRIFLFTALNECLFNIVKYAGVKSARVDVGRRPEHIFICVSDHGTGFDVTAAGAKAETGESFGLFSIRQRMGLLGGRVAVLSQYGQGTRIEFVVPLTQGGTIPKGEADRTPGWEIAPATINLAAPSASAPGQSVRVLLADDHQMLREGVAAMLVAHRDIEVVAQARDGLEAIELAMLHRPDVVVMDLNMPRLGGLEATKILHQRLPETIVIGMSMDDREELAASMIRAGAVAYVNKGGPTEQLVEEIRQAIRARDQ